MERTYLSIQMGIELPIRRMHSPVTQMSGLIVMVTALEITRTMMIQFVTQTMPLIQTLTLTPIQIPTLTRTPLQTLVKMMRQTRHRGLLKMKEMKPVQVRALISERLG